MSRITKKKSRFLAQSINPSPDFLYVLIYYLFYRFLIILNHPTMIIATVNKLSHGSFRYIEEVVFNYCVRELQKSCVSKKWLRKEYDATLCISVTISHVRNPHMIQSPVESHILRCTVVSLAPSQASRIPFLFVVHFRILRNNSHLSKTPYCPVPTGSIWTDRCGHNAVEHSNI